MEQLTQYEHHAAIRQNRLCPFFLRIGKNLRDTVCNWHQNIELFLITDGYGRIKCGEKTYALSPGDLVVVNSGVLHRIYSTEGISYYCVIVDDQFCKDNGVDTAEYEFCEHFRNAETERRFLDAVNKLQSAKQNTSPLSTPKIRCAVLSLLIALCENHARPKNTEKMEKKRTEDTVKHAIAYINDHYASAFSLEQLALAVGVSKFHMEREFKKYTDQTPFTYLNALRCKKAELLISQGATVTEAAFACGFENLSYFSRTYKKRMGIPPSKVK